jgi:putative ABC transport system permease protein
MTAPAFKYLVGLSLAECCGAWKRLVFFILCLAVGVGAVMTVKNFATLLRNAVQKESKAMLAADIEIGSSWEQSARDREFQQQALPPGTETLFIKDLHAMARFARKAEDGAREQKNSNLLVELKAVPLTPPLYPFYGALKIRPAETLPNLLGQRGAIVEPGFLTRSGLAVGDVFELGKIQARITGVIEGEPDRITRAFSLGPRVMVSLDTLTEANLIQPGSRIKHRTLIRLPENADVEKTATLLENGLSDKSASLRTHKNTESSITHSIERIGQYLGSVASIALLMGGIGVAMIIRAFMAQKTDTIAILHCLGATARTIFKIYLLQSAVLGAVGSLAGIGLGYAAQWFLQRHLAGLLNIDVRPELHWPSALQALALGMATTLLFGVWPLIRAVKTRPLRLFRNLAEDEEPARASLSERWLAGSLPILGLGATLFWQAESVRRGAVFLAAVAVSTLLLAGVSFLALRLLRALPPSRTIARRYGLANLHRPNNHAISIITAIGMGVMLVLGVRLIQMDTVALLQENTEHSPPNFFFIDIQKDQRDRFADVIKQTAPLAEWELVPLIRARLHSADERTSDRWVYKNRHDEEWFIQREFVLTVGDGGKGPPVGNTLVKGQWWLAEENTVPQVSVEEDAARRLGLSLGSTLSMDIQGVRVSAPVTSIRKVDWRNMRTNFYMIFSPGALTGAPMTYVGAVRVAKNSELPLQTTMVDALPNLTAIGTRDITETVEAVTGKLLTLVDFMSAFTIAVGLLILSGAVASTKFRRLKEAAILKTLGATRRTVAVVLGYEYAALGAIAGVTGAGLSLLLSWAVMHHIIQAPWRFRPLPVAWGLLLAVALTTLAGILSSLDVLTRKPLHTLRKLDG